MDAALRAELQQRLLAWFSRHRRDLPFRRERTPYRVLLAEVMSQQTAAEAVGPYLERFLARFPDLAALAAADLEEVLALWQGLGYYSRARNLHRAAQEAVRLHAGRVPADQAALRALPGVGPYIAGAVASIAFGQDVAAFDANALRVLSRLFDRERADPALAQALLPPGRAGEWNEALMDFGALVCVPRAPRCGICPLAHLCAGLRAGRAASLPLRSPRRARPEVAVTTLLLRDAAGRFGLCQRPPQGLLAGMWEFPSAEGAVVPEEVARRHDLVLTAAPAPLQPFRHVFTHRVWLVRPYQVSGAGPVRWVAPEQLELVPLAGPAARLARGAEGAGTARAK